MSTTYQTLLQEFVPRPILSQRALKQVNGLIRKANRTRAEDDVLELLSTLVEQYEIRQGYVVPELSPARPPRDRLAGRRAISKANALRLANYFGVPAAEFIAE